MKLINDHLVDWDDSLKEGLVPSLRKIFPDPDEDYVDVDHDIEIIFID